MRLWTSLLLAWHDMTWYGMAWHGINNLGSMRIPDECQHQFRALNHMLLLIGNFISIWQPDHLISYHIMSYHDLSTSRTITCQKLICIRTLIFDAE
jgi:hypothetical protein